MKRMFFVLAMVPMMARGLDLAPGTLEVTGSSNLGFGSSSTELSNVSGSTDTTTFNLNTTGLYYVIPNLGVGLNLAWNSTENKDSNTGDKTGLSTVLLGPAIGYAIPVAEKMAIGLQGMIGYASSTYMQTGFPDVKFAGWGLGLGAGIKYFVVPAFSIDAGVGYLYTKLTSDTTDAFGTKPDLKTSSFNVNAGLSVYFGR